MFDENRRKYPRVNYPCQLTIWLTDGSNETIMANTTNIGIGGLCVHLHQEIVVGTKLDIQLTFANTTTPFKCTGRAVRCFKEKERYYNVGVQFDPLNELKNAFLLGQVSELLDLEKKGNS